MKYKGKKCLQGRSHGGRQPSGEERAAPGSSCKQLPASGVLKSGMWVQIKQKGKSNQVWVAFVCVGRGGGGGGDMDLIPIIGVPAGLWAGTGLCKYLTSILTSTGTQPALRPEGHPPHTGVGANTRHSQPFKITVSFLLLHLLFYY